MAAVLVGVLFSVGFFSDLGVLFGVLFMVELRTGVFWTGSVGWGSSCSMTGGSFVSFVFVFVFVLLFSLF